MPKKKASSGKKKSKSKKSKSAPVEVVKRDVKTPEDALFDSCKLLRWWLSEESAKISEYFTKRDTEPADAQKGSLLISTEEFVLALRYLQAPISSFQTNLVVKYLERSAGFVDVVKFKDLQSKDDIQLLEISQTTPLVAAKEDNSSTDTLPSSGKGKKGKKSKKTSDETVPPVAPIKQTSEYHLEVEPRYVRLKLLLATFKRFEKHPGHITLPAITITTTIHGICMLIQEHLCNTTCIQSIAVFTDPSCTKQSYLDPSWTLESCGVPGSLIQYEPRSHQLYYDYIPQVIDCPLLMTDICMRQVPTV